MAISKLDRAKQFLPFDALKGFKEALKEKEIVYVEKIELSEYEQELISEKLKTIIKGDRAYIKYYSNGQYKNVTEQIKYIDIINKKIILCDDTKINFVDILNIKKE